MFEYLKYKWLQLRLLIKIFLKRKEMIVTQQNIDDAIEQANASKEVLRAKIMADLKKGKETCKDDLQMYLNLDNAIWLLESAAIFVEQECINTDDVWVQINFIRENSCALPKKPTVITNVLNWLITNTGLDILTNSNKQIITT
jgi:uncharacterized protein YdcH (DUF465 family)